MPHIDMEALCKTLSAGGEIVEFPHGVETLRVFRAGDWVYKIRYQNLEKENIDWHNEFFGNVTPYEILGSTIWQEREAVLLKQPYIEFMPESDKIARAQLIAWLCQDYETVLSADEEVWADGWHFDNLGELNVGIDKCSDKFAVVDCLIRQRSEGSVRDLWKSCGFVIVEHIDKESVC